MKFALGTLLPAVAGSVAGSAAGPGGFSSAQTLATESAVAGNRMTANKVSDVPPVIAANFTVANQRALMSGLLAASPPLMAGAPIFESGDVPDTKAAIALLSSSARDCLRVVQVGSITFEHSKDYKSRNAIVVRSNVWEFQKGKKKAVISITSEVRTPIRTYLPGQSDASPQLIGELDAAFAQGFADLAARFAKKSK